MCSYHMAKMYFSKNVIRTDIYYTYIPFLVDLSQAMVKTAYTCPLVHSAELVMQSSSGSFSLVIDSLFTYYLLSVWL